MKFMNVYEKYIYLNNFNVYKDICILENIYKIYLVFLVEGDERGD